MTGIELAAWLIVHAEALPITMLATGGRIASELTGAQVRSCAYLPADALVARGEVVVLLSELHDADV